MLLMRISHRLRHPRLTPLLAVYLGAMSTVGSAQQYDAERDEATNPDELETIIVTARRTAESGFDLATSWAILDQANIERVARSNPASSVRRAVTITVSTPSGFFASSLSASYCCALPVVLMAHR